MMIFQIEIFEISIFENSRIYDAPQSQYANLGADPKF